MDYITQIRAQQYWLEFLGSGTRPLAKNGLFDY
jgi:hypothetical protein